MLKLIGIDARTPPTIIANILLTAIAKEAYFIR